MFWEGTKDPNVTDRFGVNIGEDWLDGETITNVVVEAPPLSGITITDINFLTSPLVTALFSNGVVGFWPIHWRIETVTRQYEVCVTLWVKESC